MSSIIHFSLKYRISLEVFLQQFYFKNTNFHLSFKICHEEKQIIYLTIIEGHGPHFSFMYAYLFRHSSYNKKRCYLQYNY